MHLLKILSNVAFIGDIQQNEIRADVNHNLNY